MASEPKLPSMVVDSDSDSESTDDGFDDCLEIPSAALQEACLPADDLPVDTLLECKIPSVFEPRELSEEAQFPYTEPSALVEVSSQELQDSGIPSFERVASLLRAGKAQRKQGTKSVTFRGKSFPFWILALWDEALTSQLAWNRSRSWLATYRARSDEKTTFDSAHTWTTDSADITIAGLSWRRRLAVNDNLSPNVTLARWVLND